MICDVGEVTVRLENEQKRRKGWRSAHSPSFPSLHLRHSSFSNPSAALPTSQLILQPFCCFIYVTALSPTLLSLLLRHKIFTYVTRRAAHDNSYLRNKERKWQFTVRGRCRNIEASKVEIFSPCYVHDFIVDLHGNYFKIYF